MEDSHNPMVETPFYTGKPYEIYEIKIAVLSLLLCPLSSKKLRHMDKLMVKIPFAPKIEGRNMKALY